MSGEQVVGSVEAVEAAAVEAVRATGLLGCGCCVYSDAYDGDGCPRDEDGFVDHTYEGDCAHEVGRTALIVRAVLASLSRPGQERTP